MFRNNKNYQDFKTTFAGLYHGGKLCYLRFLMSSHLTANVLGQRNITGATFFNQVESNGSISPTDVNMFWEIAEVTDVASAKKCVIDYKIKNNVNANTGKGLHPYRKLLYEALMNVGPGELPDAVAYYQQESNRDINSVWDLVFYLDTNDDLDTRAKLQTLAFRFNRRVQQKITKGLAALFPKNEDGTVSLEQGNEDLLTDLVPKPKEQVAAGEQQDAGEPGIPQEQVAAGEQQDAGEPGIPQGVAGAPGAGPSAQQGGAASAPLIEVYLPKKEPKKE